MTSSYVICNSTWGEGEQHIHEMVINLIVFIDE
jgi:hypothetical protein